MNMTSRFSLLAMLPFFALAVSASAGGPILSKEYTLRIPFASDEVAERVSVDAPVSDPAAITRADAFRVEFSADPPDTLAISHMTLYFRSENGWYHVDISSSELDMAENGRFQAKFPRRLAKSGRDKPGPWENVDLIRFSAWRGAPVDATLVLHDIRPVRSPTGLHADVVRSWQALHRVGDPRTNHSARRIERTRAFLAELQRRGFTLTADFFRHDVDPTTVDPLRPRLLELNEALQIMQKEEVRRFCDSLPSGNFEMRAWWESAGCGPYPGDWDRTMRELADAGFNAVMPIFSSGGMAHYDTDLFPKSNRYEKYGDQLEQAVRAGKKHGVEVHARRINFFLFETDGEFFEEMKRQGRVQKDRGGRPKDSLCPSHPENIELECDAMCEIVRKYDVDGIHYDYIRYPDSGHCFCERCRDRFVEETGSVDVNWPDDVLDGKKLRERYIQWRCDNITRLVARIHREAKAVKPEVRISAAVFSEYPSCRRNVAQDWPLWIERGYLDFACPMNYTENPARFENMVERQIRHVGKAAPLRPGIGAAVMEGGRRPDRVAAQIGIASDLKTSGFVLFNLTPGTIREIIPFIRTKNGP